MADYDLSSLTEFKLEVTAAAAKTLTLGPYDYELYHTGNYDNAGSKAANTADLFWCDGDITLAKDYSSDDADDRGSIPLLSGEHVRIQGGRDVIIEPATGAITVVIVRRGSI